MAARQADGPFHSVDDLARRASLRSLTLTKLSAADACRSLQLDRRQALWNSLIPRDEMPLFDHADDDDAADFPALPAFQEVAADYQSIGLTLRQHPLSFLRDELNQAGVLLSKDLATIDENSIVQVAGLVLLRQQPQTAKGIRFITLEDETGVVNLVVHPNIWDRYRRMAARASALWVSGKLERQGIIIHVVVSRIEDISHSLVRIRTQSRDFR